MNRAQFDRLYPPSESLTGSSLRMLDGTSIELVTWFTQFSEGGNAVVKINSIDDYMGIVWIKVILGGSNIRIGDIIPLPLAKGHLWYKYDKSFDKQCECGLKGEHSKEAHYRWCPKGS